MPDTENPEFQGTNSDSSSDREKNIQSPIPQEVKEIIEGLPSKAKSKVEGYLTGISIERASFRSPIPPPKILKEYNEIIPDGANRILKMTENQSEHRIEMEKFWATQEMKQSGNGQMFAFILAILFLVAAFILIFTGAWIAGTTLGTVDLVALVTVFIVGKRSMKDNLDDVK